MWLRHIFFLLFSSFLITNCSAAPAVDLHDSEGRAINMATFKNKWVIVNYWADWCDSCIAEMPELNNFYQHNKDKNILMYGVNYDQLPLPTLKRSMRKTGIDFPVLLEDPNALWKLGYIDAIPVTFIISPEGYVVKKIIGPNTEVSLQTQLNTILSNS
jgi:thiol-disulfide isomerase/thioredoxin